LSPRKPEENQQIRDERREAILRAAAGVFAAMGLGPAKIGDIAQAAGVSYGLVYHYFGAKEAVFAALVEQGARATAGLVEYLRRQESTAWAQLHWLTETMVQGLSQTPELLLVSLEALTKAAVSPEIRERARLGNEQLRKAVAALIARGQAEGTVVAGDPDALAILYLSSLNGLATTLLALRPEPVRLPETDALLRMLKA
jgi:AcrR family transcriptional regulator